MFVAAELSRRRVAMLDSTNPTGRVLAASHFGPSAAPVDLW